MAPAPSAPVPDTVLCPRCGSGFQCSAKAGGCWCSNVMVSDQVRADMSAFYNGCLCRACLQTLEDSRPSKPSVWAFLKKNLRRSPE